MTKKDDITILVASALLDIVASGKMSQDELCLAMMDAGLLSVDLFKIILARGGEEKNAELVSAAECLKNLSLDSDVDGWKVARDSAKAHSDALFKLLGGDLIMVKILNLMLLIALLCGLMVSCKFRAKEKKGE
jgi:hypothetical protein